MSPAAHCDRCGKPLSGKPVYVSAPAWMFGMPGWTGPFRRELCGDCAASLERWFRLAANPAPPPRPEAGIAAVAAGPRSTVRTVLATLAARAIAALVGLAAVARRQRPAIPSGKEGRP